MQFNVPFRPAMTYEEFQALQRQQLARALAGQPIDGVASNPAMVGQSPLAVPPVVMPQRFAPQRPAGPGGWGQANYASGATGSVPMQRDAPIQIDAFQRNDEPGWHYMMRWPGIQIARVGAWGTDQLGQLAQGLTDTPAQARARVEARRTEALPQAPADMASSFAAGPRSPSGPGSRLDIQRFFTTLERSGANAVSHAGARGTMQIMPGTARDVARELGVPWDEQRYLTDDSYRIPLATRYGEQQVARFGPVLGAAAYNAGPGRVEEWIRRFGDPRTGQISIQDFINRIPIQETRDYAARALQLTGPQGGMGPIMPLAFDESGYREAQQMMLQAGQLAMQPMEATVNPGPMPELPAPQPIEPADFSRVEARLEANRPQPMEDRERLRMQRRGWMAGIARGLASVDLSATGGAGVGQLFAALGAGALAGRAAADEEITRREDLFDEQMRDYNRAMANMEMGRANEIAQTARYNAQQAYDHSLRQFQLRFNDWEVQARPQISGGRIFTTRINEDGTRTIRSAPIDQSAMAAAMMQAAQIPMAIAAGRNEVGQANWQFNSAYALSQAGQSGEPQDMATAVGIRVAEAFTSGLLQQLVGEDDFNEVVQAATAAANAAVPPMQQGEAADARRAQIMQTQIIQWGIARVMQDQTLRSQLFGDAGSLAGASVNAQRQFNARTTVQERQPNRPGQLPTMTTTIRQ